MVTGDKGPAVNPDTTVDYAWQHRKINGIRYAGKGSNLPRLFRHKTDRHLQMAFRVQLLSEFVNTCRTQHTPATLGKMKALQVNPTLSSSSLL